MSRHKWEQVEKRVGGNKSRQQWVQVETRAGSNKCRQQWDQTAIRVGIRHHGSMAETHMRGVDITMQFKRRDIATIHQWIWFLVTFSTACPTNCHRSSQMVSFLLPSGRILLDLCKQSKTRFIFYHLAMYIIKKQFSI